MRAVRVADATDGRMPDAQRCFFIVLFTDEKYDKVTFLFSYFSMTKRRVQGGVATSERRRRDGVSGKSHLRGFSILLKIFFRVHELVARSSAWRVCAAKDKVKVGGIAALLNLILPRVRTYHTKKPSRFVHALSARPLKVQGGRGCDMCVDGIKGIFFLLAVGGIWILE